MKIARCTLVPVALALSGCIIDPTHVEDDFGSSVRQMIAAQIYDPEAASNPDPNAPELVDGVAASRAVTGYRQDAKRVDRVEDRLRFLDPDEDDED